MRQRLLAMLAMLLTALAVVVFGASAAQADGPTISVKLIDSQTKKPVPGVTVQVADDKGTSIGTATSNDVGVAAIPIPGNGKYIVTLDEDTLPPGIKLTGRKKLTVPVNLATNQFVQFPLNQKVVKETPWIDRLADSAVSGVKYGLIIALASLGLSLVFGTTGLTNFAHGELITLGAIVAYGFNVGLGLPVVVAGIFAVVVGALFGWGQDRLLWRPLRRRGTGLIAMMIVSIGFGLLLRNVFQYVFSADTKSFTSYTSQRAHDFGPVGLADKEIAIMLIAIVTIGVTTFAMSNTRLGKAMRAVSDNPALSASSGLRVDGVISAVWTLGTALAALSGVLLAVNSQIDFAMGNKLLLMVFAATTLGGLGTIWGAVIGSLIIGLITEVGPMFGVPSSIKEVGALIVLIIILLVRPQGILGRAERIG